MTSDTISTGDLVDLLGISDVALQKLAKKHVVEKLDRGLWPMPDTVRRYIRHLQEVAAGRQDETSAAAEKRALLGAQAELKKLALAERRGDLVSRVDVDRVARASVTALREALLRIGGRVGPQLAPVGTAAGCAEIVDGAIRDALDELAGLEVVAADGD